MTLAGTASEAWDEAEPHVFRLMLRAALYVSLWGASPFFAFAFGFWLFDKPLLWIAIPAALGVLVLLLGLVLFLVVRAKLRRLRQHLATAETVERITLGP